MGHSRTIVIADEDSHTRNTLGEGLHRLGYRVIEVCDGRKATLHWAEWAPDLLITEMLLPGASGLRLTDAVRNGMQSSLPIVMISGVTTRAHQDYAYALGVNAFLVKPIAANHVVELATVLCPLNPRINWNNRVPGPSRIPQFGY